MLEKIRLDSTWESETHHLRISGLINWQVKNADDGRWRQICTLGRTSRPSSSSQCYVSHFMHDLKCHSYLSRVIWVFCFYVQYDSPIMRACTLSRMYVRIWIRWMFTDYSPPYHIVIRFDFGCGFHFFSGVWARLEKFESMAQWLTFDTPTRPASEFTEHRFCLWIGVYMPCSYYATLLCQFESTFQGWWTFLPEAANLTGISWWKYENLECMSDLRKIDHSEPVVLRWRCSKS